MRQEHAAPVTTPGGGGSANANAKRIFFVSALNMSWQLAIVVLVPIVGGFELDGRLHSSPWLTIGGFILAMLGTFLVMRRMLNEALRLSRGGQENRR